MISLVKVIDSYIALTWCVPPSMQPGPDWRGSVVPHTAHVVKTTLMQKIIFAAGMMRI